MTERVESSKQPSDGSRFRLSLSQAVNNLTLSSGISLQLVGPEDMISWISADDRAPSQELYKLCPDMQAVTVSWCMFLPALASTNMGHWLLGRWGGAALKNSILTKCSAISLSKR